MTKVRLSILLIDASVQAAVSSNGNRISGRSPRIGITQK